MRIICQDKATDIPYEQSALIIETANEGNFYINAYMGDKYFWLGTYHSLVDAKAVLSAVIANKKAERDYYELPGANEDLGYAYRVM